ncbi:hypothetical protein B0T14DRAFT_511660 [Immersiella caudata]|uniref:Uncharacterized protein n=1 Tax=Immersiella caudata TaxID=314043 RepID=A0AA40C7I3_9PEZI|nr:hypothetical protein B0T14DRAFT_511660 [Immersiella caudata]
MPSSALFPRMDKLMSVTITTLRELLVAKFAFVGLLSVMGTLMLGKTILFDLLAANAAFCGSCLECWIFSYRNKLACSINPTLVWRKRCVSVVGEIKLGLLRTLCGRLPLRGSQVVHCWV